MSQNRYFLSTQGSRRRLLTVKSAKEVEQQLKDEGTFESFKITRESDVVEETSKRERQHPTHRVDSFFYSWFARDITKILKSKPGGLQNFYLHLRKDSLKIYLFTIP